MIDTICALATAPGGALGIIRISGPQALEILSHVFTKSLTNAQPNTIHYGHIKDGDSIVDEVLVSLAYNLLIFYLPIQSLFCHVLEKRMCSDGLWC